MKASEIFTPGRFPTHTFVDEHLQERGRQLRDTLEAGSTLISISGPSKSGKTVFIEKVLGRENLIQVTGAGISSAAGLWMRVFDMVGTEVPSSVARSGTKQRTIGGKGSVEGGIMLVRGKGEVSVESQSSNGEIHTSSI